MKKLAIYGAGGHGRVVADTASMLGWQEIVFYDESWPQHQKNSIWPVVGNYENLLASLAQYDGVIVAFGNCVIRLEKTRELARLGASIISLVHSKAFVSPNSTLGQGSVVFAGAVINIEAKVGEASIVNIGATVDHDCIIGPGVHIGPGANLSGGVDVGETSWVGVGSCVRQGIKIGANVMIGAGAVIVKDVPSGSTMIGSASMQISPQSINSMAISQSFLNWPSFTAEEAKAIQNVLLSNKVNYWTGQECRLFETEFAKWCGSRYAVALANGTLALDLALQALRIDAGDEVIVTPRTFIASISCVVNIGAIPVFADVDRNSGNITPDTIAKVITPKTKAIICVHLAGWPCDMDGIMALANLHGLKVIEDCAQAHGALYKGKSVGTIGHIGAWSFCQDKIMTTGGEGGMVTTNDESLWRAMWAYKDHGKSYAAVYEREHPPGYRWLHESFGTNWRMLEMQAAIGRIQLKRMPDWTARRNENARTLTRGLQEFIGPNKILRLPQFACNAECSATKQVCQFRENNQCQHAFYKYYVYLNNEKLASGWSRDRISDAINEQGIPCYSGSCSEVYMERAFDEAVFKPASRLPVAKELGETTLMFLVHPTLTARQMEGAASTICEVLSKACQ